MALPGLRRLDHIGFTVPDLDEASRFLVDVLGCEYLYSLGPFADDGDWMAEHLNVHPRAAVTENRFFRLRRQAIFEVFHYTSPDQRTRAPAQQRHRRPPRRALRRRPRRRRRPPARRPASRSSAGRPPARARTTGNRWVYFLAPWGMQFELVSYPGGKAFDRERARP